MTVALCCSVVLRRAAGAVLLCAGVLLAPGASAAKNATLYKCVDAAGVTSIQSSPCPAGSTQAWRRDAPTEPAPTAEQAAQADAKRMRDQQAVRELSEIVDKKLQVASGTAAAAAAAPPAVVPTPASAEATASASTEAVAVEACQKAQAFAASVREQAWLALSEEQVRRLYGWVAEQCKLPAPAN